MSQKRAEKQGPCSRRLHRYAAKLLPFAAGLAPHRDESWARAAANFFARTRHSFEGCDLCGNPPPPCAEEWGLTEMMDRIARDDHLTGLFVAAIEGVGPDYLLLRGHRKRKDLAKAEADLSAPRLPGPQFLEARAPYAAPDRPNVNSTRPRLIEVREFAIRYDEDA